MRGLGRVERGGRIQAQGGRLSIHRCDMGMSKFALR